ncbi:hypothetical protein [Paenibacillus oleatilyticus]|uniref:hypothetical protein n=1 Tax=Paenibacillus oleatilyticus TaxID=2594886 RepID=UPI001C1F82BB|nr:hypothetical protein [Paenibacillus oleatilyticus]MBU7318623.1 hypothetical protein [Paenibacillus oleatilyticus]
MAYEAKTNWQLDDTVTEQDMNRIEQGLKDAYENSMTSPPPEQVNLGYGLQVVDAKRTAPLENVCIKGRTLVNLLGRDGNFESSPTGWSNFQSTTVFDTANKAYGLQSLKVNITSTSGGIVRTGQTFKAGKFYLVAADIKNGNASLAFISLDSLGQSNTVSDKTKFSIAYRKVNPASDTTINVSLLVNGAVDQYAYFDGVRIYEITPAEYSAIDSMTSEQISAKWPYVDDMKSIYSPYVIRYGENLLPPFTEWEMIRTDNGTSILNPYKIKQQTTAIDAWLGTSKIPCTPSTEYTLSMIHTGKILLRFYKKDGTFVDAGGGYTTEQSVTGISPADVDYIVVYTTNPQPVGTFTFENGMLNVGSMALRFKPRQDDYLFFPNVQLASNVDGMVCDTLFQKNGKFFKNTRLKTINLDGSLSTWVSLNGMPGYKLIVCKVPPHNFNDFKVAVKYDGKIMTGASADNITEADQWLYRPWESDNFYISVSNVDSGWGDSYKPSEEEIKAYVNGWRMFEWEKANNIPYNRSDNLYKAWVQIGQANPGSSVDTSQTLPTTMARNYGYKPYKFQYQLATPVVEEIAAEGGVTFREGLNQVEVGNGMIVREGTTPAYDGGSRKYNINAAGYPAVLKNRVEKYFALYKNEQMTTDYIIAHKGDMTGLQANGDWLMRVSDMGGYDPSIAYTVTYLALDQFAITCNALSIQGEYAGNMKTVVDTLAASQAELLARVGVLENTKAQKVQGQWITPTLLNGWVREGSGYSNPGYYKDQFGSIHLSGVIRGGSTSTFTVLFYLPALYRPKNRTNLVFFTFDGSSTGICSLHIEADGAVKIGSINCKQYISLDGISFLAER